MWVIKTCYVFDTKQKEDKFWFKNIFCKLKKNIYNRTIKLVIVNQFHISSIFAIKIKQIFSFKITY